MTLSLRSPAWITLALALTACPEATTDTDKTDDTDVGETDDTTDSDETADEGFSVGGTVAGLEGEGLVLKLGSQELKVKKNGSFTFDEKLEDGESYEVKVLTSPTCKAQNCRISDGKGDVDGADVDEVRVTCDDPKIRMYTLNWGDDTIRITDDLLAVPDFGTASARVVQGKATELGDFENDGIAVDVGRDLAYVATETQILVFESASTMEGDVAPVRTMTIDASEGYYGGLELDAENDRLYVTTFEGLYVIAGASTAEGTVLPVAKALLGAMGTVTLDAVADILYISGDYTSTIYSFDAASTLSGLARPARTVTWDTDNGDMYGSPGLWIDTCTDRLYVGTNQAAKDGTSVCVIEDASLFDGEIKLTESAVATMGSRQAIALTGDGTDRLYAFKDSATSGWIYTDVSAWTGDQSETTFTTVSGVISRGYGIVVHPY